MLFLAASLPAFAADPAPAAPPAAPAAADAPAPEAAPAPAPAPAPPAPAAPTGLEDVRDTWDTAGRLVRHLVLVGDVRTEETTWKYDDAGRAIERHTDLPEGPPVVETWSFDADGHEVEHVVRRGDTEVLHETRTWEDGRLVALRVVDEQGARTTRSTYDEDGRVVLVETRDDAGELIARVVSDRPPVPLPPVPLAVKVSAGMLTNSDVRQNDAKIGFEVGRIPTPDHYDTDPLEFRAYGSYTRSAFAGDVLTDQIDAGLSGDYNEMVGPVTLFLFTKVSRNPAASLDVDLLVAPIGAKTDLVSTKVFTLDISLAPVWNFRSISSLAGETCGDTVLTQDGHCATSLFRASTRLKAAIDTTSVKLSDTVEYLPALNPAAGTVKGALDEQSVFRNTVALTLALNKSLSVTESVVFVRDPQLAAQADCVADPDNLLCTGQSLQTGSALVFTQSF